METQAKNIDRFSIVRTQDGRIGVFEKKDRMVIFKGNTGLKVKSDTLLSVVKTPAQLALDFINQQTN